METVKGGFVRTQILLDPDRIAQFGLDGSVGGVGFAAGMEFAKSFTVFANEADGRFIGP